MVPNLQTNNLVFQFIYLKEFENLNHVILEIDRHVLYLNASHDELVMEEDTTKVISSDECMDYVFMEVIVLSTGKAIIDLIVAEVPTDYFQKECYLCGICGSNKLYRRERDISICCENCLYSNWHDVNEWKPVAKGNIDGRTS